jgi:tetratricopeptide (TPR) repeat protein
MSTAPPGPDLKAFQLLRAGRHAEALAFAQQAAAGKTRCAPIHGLLATILLALGRPRDAAQVVERAIALAPGGGDAYDGLANVSMRLGRHEQANALYRRATEVAPSDPKFWYNLASSDRGLGRLAEAEAACDRAIALDPAHYPSYLLRSELRVQTGEANHVDALRRALADAPADSPAPMFLGYALAKELDDLGEYDQAFRWYAAAATARRVRLSYDVAVDVAKLRRIEEAFAKPRPAMEPRGDGPAEFIFIVGLPRSGTTLLERLMTGLAGVTSNDETDNFSRALLGATPAGPEDVFARAAAADPKAVGAAYARYAGGGPGRSVVEKLPMNYLYLGAIHAALPRAGLLLMTRSPVDSCFAMYRTLFGEAYPFSYDFEDLARYYAAYARLIGHWKSILGEALHEVRYEDLVSEPARIGAAAAAHCGLTWRDEAVEIQNNRTVSHTASASQIRRPIYATSRERWRRYQTHLEPLIDALRRHGVEDPTRA